MKKLISFILLLIGLRGLTQSIDVQHYQFTISVNDRNDSIRCQARIRFLLKYPTDSILFDLTSVQKNGKGMQVTGVLAGRQDQSIMFRQYNEKLTLSSKGLKPGDTATVLILYKGIPSDGLIISKNKFGDRTFFGDNWPNRAHHWIPCIDRPDDKASFEFIVQAPYHYRVISKDRKSTRL